MKKSYLLIALAVVAAMTVSCKNSNSKKSEKQGETKDIVAVAKVILADDVLATIDQLAETYITSAEPGDILSQVVSDLNDKEKLLKPDYLLDPAETYNLLTRKQKINALGTMLPERIVREAYDLPMDEFKAAAARLMADVNFPISMDMVNKEIPFSERVKKAYEVCKERGDLSYFWQFEFAVINSTFFLISRNPDLFLRNVTEEQYLAFDKRFRSLRSALLELAKYDEEIAGVVEMHDKHKSAGNDELDERYGTFEGFKQQIVDKKDIYAAVRNEMLK